VSCAEAWPAGAYTLLALLLVSLQVMDETAVTLCKENDIKIVIFDAMVPGNIMRAAMGEDVGTLVSHTC
jgi:uridylate kinase